MAAGQPCPDSGGSFWECCTWACDETNTVCRDCLLDGQQCLSDSQCCIGVCDATTGTCASCVPEGRPCNQVDYAPDYCCGMQDELKCSKDTKTCFQCTAIDDECRSDDECCYSCCEKGFGKSTGKCTDGDMCHMGKIIIWIIIVRLAEIGAVIAAVCLLIYWICKHCFGGATDKGKKGAAVGQGHRLDQPAA